MNTAAKRASLSLETGQESAWPVESGQEVYLYAKVSEGAREQKALVAAALRQQLISAVA